MGGNIAMQARLLGWYVLVAITISVLLAIPGFFGFSVGSAASVAHIFAAAIPGEIFYRRTGELPSSALSWRMAAVFTAVNILMGAAFLAVLGGELAQALGSSLFWMIAAVVSAISVLAMRITFPWGAKLRQRKVQQQALQKQLDSIS